jgi:hypothetical protein
MTAEDVRKRVAALEDTRDAAEAHWEEDKLHREVLALIAFGACSIEEARDLAEASLETRSLKFPRWYE